MVDALVLGKRQGVIRTVHRRTRRIYEMGYARMTAAFEHMTEGVDVVAQVGGRVRQRMANARLRGEMDDMRECAVAKQPGRGFRLGEVHARQREAGQVRKRGHPRFLQCHVVIGIEVVDAGDARALGERRARGVHADKAGRAGHEDVCVAQVGFHRRRRQIALVNE